MNFIEANQAKIETLMDMGCPVNINAPMAMSDALFKVFPKIEAMNFPEEDVLQTELRKLFNDSIITSQKFVESFPLYPQSHADAAGTAWDIFNMTLMLCAEPMEGLRVFGVYNTRDELVWCLTLQVPNTLVFARLDELFD